ncbi:hypothetical protein Amir_6152 [Actinosynnema mirum DSM 43827]|uniref:Uncharacterized protein n=1 Tax=Actinosynnema mirum (strain ATCC 29888 / DSM 43827 / JCM 3225 / NBRC 14064 / NCIMB 13271 / NRRL B-12336 / IMRU 3971 / 101) TaxID=446462 RepID=C6WHL0_ACTMD|nr:hypothetical protein Amir_6152 [Actinosynnema mirum DSM 43827]
MVRAGYRRAARTSTLGHVLSSFGRPLALTTWLAVPFVFAGAVLGLSALAGLVLGLPGDVALSSALLGAATAVTAAASGTVVWTARWQRVWLRWPFLVAVLGAGIALDGVEVPVWAALGLGLPAVVLLVIEVYLERRRTAALLADRRANAQDR